MGSAWVSGDSPEIELKIRDTIRLYVFAPLVTVTLMHFFDMAEFMNNIDRNCGSQDSIEVEFVSDEEFKILDEAIQNAVMEEGRQERPLVSPARNFCSIQ